MKKLFALGLCFILTCSMLACNTSSGNAEDTSENNDTDAETGEQISGSDDGGVEDETDSGGNTSGADVSEMPTLPDGTINVVNDWGLKPGEGNGKYNSTILMEKILNLQDGSTVYFPEGTYELIYPMYLQNKENIRIVGYHATFLRSGVVNTSASQPPSTDPDLPEILRPYTATSSVMYIIGCENVTVEGFSVKYDIPTSISGEVTSVSASRGIVEIEITDGSSVTGDEYISVINTFTDSGVPDKTLEQYAESKFEVTKLSESTIRLSGVDPAGARRLNAGTKVCLRMSTSSDYIFTVLQSSDLAFENLTLVNSLNGGFLLEERCFNAAFRNVKVQSDNPEALMSLNADVLHIASLGGTLAVENCYFESPGDDCVNVHTAAYKVANVGGNEVSVVSPRGNFSVWWASVGDVIEFFHPTTFESLGSATVTSINGQTFTFSEVPDGVTEDTVLSNKTLHPTVAIRNTGVNKNRARGFLLQTDNATVENCTFYGTALAAILIAPDLDYWYEMSPSRNVTIRNNKFENCGGYALGVIQLSADHDDATKTYPTYIHSNIVITGNSFLSDNIPALYALCTENIDFTGNEIDISRGNYAVLNFCDGVTLDESISDKVSQKNVTDVTLK